jgi:predicted SnoaL-like aldol condensation-catalyzing enzyme
MREDLTGRRERIMTRAMGLGAAACLQLLACDAATAGTSRAVSLAPLQLSGAGPGAVEVSAHPTPLSLLEDEDPVLAANKRLVFDAWRGIVNAGHVELADDLLREDYIQHSPVLPTGRAAFKKVFSAVERREIPELVLPPLVTILAEGELVVMALREELPQPGGEGHYTTTHFNLFRIEDGRLAEHWHSVQAAPGPHLPSAAEGGPQPVTGVSGSAQFALLQAKDAALAANKRLVFDGWRSAADRGSAGVADRYVGETYIEHDPNAAARPEVALQGPLVAMIAQGDLVVMVTAREHPHPSRAGETYTTTWFDMFRIKDNRLAEHWNGAVKPGGPAAKYGG